MKNNDGESMMMVQRSLRALLVFILGAVGVLPAAYGGGYMSSLVWANRSATLEQNSLDMSISLVNGPGDYTVDVFYSTCSSPASVAAMYVVVPRNIDIGGVSIAISWSGGVVIDINDSFVALADFGPSNSCKGVGPAGTYNGGAHYASGLGSLKDLPPGDYPFNLTYYVGEALADSQSEVIGLIKAHALDGNTSVTPTYTFIGVAACAQDSPTSGATIDFGTVTSNGTVQPGPLTTLGLVCNYDVALNDVNYSLTSNNPVTGEPSTGQNVAVALTNGATVTLDGGNVTQPDPKRVSVNITPSIDTRAATAGEGTGSATLTFNYE